MQLTKATFRTHCEQCEQVLLIAEVKSSHPATENVRVWMKEQVHAKRDVSQLYEEYHILANTIRNSICPTGIDYPRHAPAYDVQAIKSWELPVEKISYCAKSMATRDRTVKNNWSFEGHALA